jgi:glycosyltransferase involved in cell wall biosynthesis
MKILIATGIYPPDIGGPATYTKLIEEELRIKGYQIETLIFTKYKKFPKILRHLFYFKDLIKKSHGISFIFAQDPVSVGLPVMFASWVTGKPYLLKIVGDYAWEQSQQRFGVIDNLDSFSTRNDYRLPVKILKFIQKNVAKRAKLVLVPSRYLKKIITNWGINQDKIQVIYNSFDLKINLPAREELRQKLGLNGFVAVSVGRLVPWKGFAGLIQKFKDMPGASLLIIGSGPDQFRLGALIKSESINNVKLLGALPQGDLFEYIKAADVFVLNTGYEGFSHQLLEVMAIGTPIITTKVGGNIELITEGHNGLLYEYDNLKQLGVELSKIKDDANFGNLLVQNGLSCLKKFTKTGMINSLVELIDKNF